MFKLNVRSLKQTTIHGMVGQVEFLKAARTRRLLWANKMHDFEIAQIHIEIVEALDKFKANIIDCWINIPTIKTYEAEKSIISYCLLARLLTRPGLFLRRPRFIAFLISL